MSKERSVVLVSGGIDSALCTAMATRDGAEVFCLNVDYGQPAADIEKRQSKEIAKRAEAADSKAIAIDFSFSMGGLLTYMEGLQTSRTLEEMRNDTISPAYVPARNTVLLSLALAWAETLGAQTIVYGPTAEDQRFPDCCGPYIAAYEQVSKLGTATGPKISAPLIDMNKADVIAEAALRNVPFAETVSCYFPTLIPAGPRGHYGLAPEHCGRCDPCLIRRDGFERAGVDDPSTYRIKL